LPEPFLVDDRGFRLMVAATAVGGGKYKKAPQKQTEIVTVPQLTPIKLGFSKKREIKHSMLSPALDEHSPDTDLIENFDR
jgi:hypothetical protein